MGLRYAEGQFQIGIAAQYLAEISGKSLNV
ncbi:hypothetical protein HKBW3S44_01355 [Candidatus Hakubella thermalkaliphila]|uniref:Uncharacterized protein n=1 Tax=Candidatus Hakubella thermalkaliphila TaxID=2754717 RepID=A0A6V8PYU7_9ACTN|nr:hypothetical protein HKBW3S44_01355 [Candidatus Hakubella thermalkaliphila]